ncbi:restriction endonuclease subunit S [Geomonas sp. Red32]|uniref:restriction endonuclease subunit S n=1 Tax=Geomonas sp. Red32 TaxID=2912856 RepID=UPI00202CE4CC|nr:restriction endonuclease subunit S [Geomonas sp. Red32]
MNWETVPWCECSEKELKSSRVRCGDIVFARTGATTGKSYLIKECPEDTVFASYLIRVRLDQKADPCYVSHFFQTEDYWNQITKGARGAAQPGVNASTLKTLEIPLPPIKEQKRIAAILDAADALRTKRRESLAQLDTLLRSTFLDMFGDPVIHSKPQNVHSFFEVTSRITYGFTCPMEHVREGIPIITAKNVRQGEIDFENCHFATPTQFEQLTDKCKPEPGDLLITKDGAIRGRCALVKTKLPFCISQAVALVRPDRSSVVPEYLWGYIVNYRIQRKIMEMDKGAAMPHLQITELGKFPIKLPPLALQRRFAAVVESVEQQKNWLRAHLAELDTLFASLQHRAFNGDL